ncbi:MAG TPA: hypothetical protein P5119_09600 [Candidatus Aminicenantes bacterium]|nr:hypothetical protein [Candidatus Aminicenantes bacterium]HRY65577.1 hypothetical protein [Candidatus Aminicenantes bacterium]HRZ72535.1 hypothetical protein [Candidatus Aminicenantes bacterium]
MIRKPRRAGPPRKLRTEHTVKVSVKGRKIEYDRHCVHVQRGDTIVWHLDRPWPFAVIVKAVESPLDWTARVAPRGARALAARVRADAAPGFYPYAFCVSAGEALLVDDPEIIVRPPAGGRG